MRLSHIVNLTLAVSCALLLALSTGVNADEQQTYSSNWYVVNSGGSYASTSNYLLLSSFAQPTVGITGTGTYYMSMGFVSDSAPIPVKIVDVETQSLPVSYSLSQNFPNPFNPTTSIEFSLPHSGYVTMDVFDIRGRKVTTLISEDMAAGVKRVDWDGRDHTGNEVASGVYFYRLRVNEFSQTRKMLLLK